MLLNSLIKHFLNSFGIFFQAPLLFGYPWLSQLNAVWLSVTQFWFRYGQLVPPSASFFLIANHGKKGLYNHSKL